MSAWSTNPNASLCRVVGGGCRRKAEGFSDDSRRREWNSKKQAKGPSSSTRGGALRVTAAGESLFAPGQVD